jgi:hypothetical protein
MLRTVKQFIDENGIAAECTSEWDEATCDGYCLADDCDTAADMLEDATASMQEEIERIVRTQAQEREGYQGMIKQLQAEVEALKSERNLHLDCFSEISNQCIGEVAMNYRLDACSIGQSIYKATGMTSSQLSQYAEYLHSEPPKTKE